MSPQPERRWRVSLTTWDAWTITVSAPDAATAEDRVEMLWAESTDPFKHRNSGIESISLEPVDEEVAS